MKPRIDRTQFGSVIIDGKVFEHDVVIRLDGKVAKRKKQLSKAVYGTSHTISLAEAKHVYQKGAARLIIGAGQSGTVALSEGGRLFQAKRLPGGAVADARGDPGLERGRGGRDRPAPRDVLSGRCQEAEGFTLCHGPALITPMRLIGAASTG